jgi:hypothetical protein
MLQQRNKILSTQRNCRKLYVSPRHYASIFPAGAGWHLARYNHHPGLFISHKRKSRKGQNHNEGGNKPFVEEPFHGVGLTLDAMKWDYVTTSGCEAATQHRATSTQHYICRLKPVI